MELEMELVMELVMELERLLVTMLIVRKKGRNLARASRESKAFSFSSYPREALAQRQG